MPPKSIPILKNLLIKRNEKDYNSEIMQKKIKYFSIAIIHFKNKALKHKNVKYIIGVNLSFIINIKKSITKLI